MEVLFIELSKVVSVFAWSFFSFWSAIPAGLALGLSPLTVIVTTTLSYACGVGMVVFLGGQVRAWILQRYRQQAAEQQNGRLGQIWERYGMIGLGFLAPMTVGAQIGAVFGIALQASARRLFVAMTVGALVWSLVITAGCLLGIVGVQAIGG